MKKTFEIQIFKNYLTSQMLVNGAKIPSFVSLKTSPVTNYLMSESFYTGQAEGLRWVTKMEALDANGLEKKIKEKLMQSIVAYRSVLLTEERIIKDFSDSYIKLAEKVEVERLQPGTKKSLDEVIILGFNSVLYWGLGII